MIGSNACPSPVELTRELSTGPRESISAHIARCDSCAAEWASIERVAVLAKQLPGLGPELPRVDSVRSSLLGATAVPPTSRRSLAFPVVFAVAAAAAIALVLGGYLLLGETAPNTEIDGQPQVAEIFRAAVHAHDGAAYAIVGSQPDEIVRLTDGMATFEVEHLGDGERFRVVTGDAEVEVRGTVFDVSVEDDSLVSVHVISGEVEVRPFEDEHEILVAGQWWRREAASAVAVNPAVVRGGGQTSSKPEGGQSSSKPGGGHAHPAVVREGGQTSSDPEPSPAPAQPAPPAPDPQAAFEQGWSALRSGDFKTAEKALGEAAAGADPISEDASFWRAVALARSGKRAQAVRSLQSFLSRFPGSPRAGEASVMLGKMLLDSGNLNGAEARFRAALQDPGSRIRASAAAGLAAVERRRADPASGLHQ